jgi:transposase-like protein
MVKEFEARYYCLDCNKNFTEKRDSNMQNSVKCKSCKKSNYVVRYNHPYVKIALDKIKEEAKV